MGRTPRLTFQDLPGELAYRLAPRVDRLGYLGEFFQVAAHAPGPLGYFVDFTEALKQALPIRVVEAIALTVSAQTANGYERVQHERYALRMGLSEDEVRALVHGEAGPGLFNAFELAAVELSREVVAARGGSCREPYAKLEALAGPEAAVECLMTATRYLAHATMANTWELSPPVSSPLEPERSGG
jgi:alkylhydroperoxidase family enzyme